MFGICFIIIIINLNKYSPLALLITMYIPRRQMALLGSNYDWLL